MTDLDCILAAITIYVAVIAIMCFAWGRETARLRALVLELHESMLSEAGIHYQECDLGERVALTLHAIDDAIGGEPQDAFANQHKHDDGNNDR